MSSRRYSPFCREGRIGNPVGYCGLALCIPITVKISASAQEQEAVPQIREKQQPSHFRSLTKSSLCEQPTSQPILQPHKMLLPETITITFHYYPTQPSSYGPFEPIAIVCHCLMAAIVEFLVTIRMPQIRRTLQPNHQAIFPAGPAGNIPRWRGCYPCPAGDISNRFQRNCGSNKVDILMFHNPPSCIL